LQVFPCNFGFVWDLIAISFDSSILQGVTRYKKNKNLGVQGIECLVESLSVWLFVLVVKPLYGGQIMQEQRFEPMSIGRILDRSFRIYRANFIHFIAITAIILVPISLIQLVGISMIGQGIPSESSMMNDVEMEEPQNTEAEGAYSEESVYEEEEETDYSPGGFLMIFGTSLVNAALTKSVSASYLGCEVSVGEAYQAVIPKIMTLIGAGILVGLIVMFGYMLLIVPGVIFGLWYSLTNPAIIVENCKATEALKRSKALAKGNLGKIFGVLFVTGIITNLITYLFGMMGGVFSKILMSGNFVLNQICNQIFTVAGQILGIPIMAAAIILLYYDLRIRKEGFDLEMMAQSLSLVDTDSSIPSNGFEND